MFLNKLLKKRCFKTRFVNSQDKNIRGGGEWCSPAEQVEGRKKRKTNYSKK
jgi:hypothetical protein